jgi:4-amino-4-deoxy-L-arabinose transferase-like glycosyltransferase
LFTTSGGRRARALAEPLPGAIPDTNERRDYGLAHARVGIVGARIYSVCVSRRHPRGRALGVIGRTLIVILLFAAALRFLFPTADPPWRTTVGVVWHDEGAWTHNARNRALFGTWRTDNWNPMFIAPVFTGLEYASFAAFGVGIQQARLVSQIAGLAAVLLIGLGVASIAGRTAGLIAALMLGTNYVAVMYDRAAIMEASMSAFIVTAWTAFARAQSSPRWGLVAGIAAVAAFFTKAAAAFFIVALGLTALASIVPASRWSSQRLAQPEEPVRGPQGAAGTLESGAAWWTLAGLVLAAGVALATFVLPFWQEYHFYNWQMSVTRKPSYDLASLITRLTWFPVLHDVLTRMWLVAAVGLLAWLWRVVALREINPAERLLVLWVGLGIAELLFHDVGNERRFVFLIPALVALAALLLARDRSLVPAWVSQLPRGRALLALPLVGYLAYVVLASLTRVGSLYDVRPSVRIGALAAAGAVVLVYATWPRVPRWLSQTWSPAGAWTLVAIIAAGNLVQFGQWAADRSYENVEASRALGRILPPGTLVHGKLANGLSLENRIRPIFVGRAFGNYEDRLTRNDVPFIVTYVAPRVGYEGPVILDVLDAYPHRRTLWTFDVAETPGGRDRAALIEKGPPAVRGALAALPTTARAHD